VVHLTLFQLTASNTNSGFPGQRLVSSIRLFLFLLFTWVRSISFLSTAHDRGWNLLFRGPRLKALVAWLPSVVAYGFLFFSFLLGLWAFLFYLHHAIDDGFLFFGVRI